MRRLLPFLLLPLPALAACNDEGRPLIPGREAPSCDMRWQSFVVTQARVPANATEARDFGLDLDHRDNDGADNVLGAAMSSIRSISDGWDVGRALAGHLERGELTWIIELGRCTDGGDEVRVRLAQASDADRDGHLEIVTTGQDSVGFGPGLATALGLARVPVGMLTDGDGALANATWIDGAALTTELELGGDGALTGRVGFAIADFTDAGLQPLADYATTAMIADGGIGEFWTDADANRNGVIDPAEVLFVVDQIAPFDLDLDADVDDRPDHRSFGMVVRAEPITLE